MLDKHLTKTIQKNGPLWIYKYNFCANILKFETNFRLML